MSRPRREDPASGPPRRGVESGTTTVRAEVSGGVGVIELNRPDARNALHPEMYDAIPRLITAYEEDSEVGCVLLTATGASFCAGGDIRVGAPGRREPREGSGRQASAAADGGAPG